MAIQYITFVSAFNIELLSTLLLFQKRFGPPLKKIKANRVFFIFRITSDLRVLAVIGGRSIPNATLTAQAIIDFVCHEKKNTKILAMFFIGIAGNLNPQFRIGDFVLCKNWNFPQQQKFLRFNNAIGLFQDPIGSLPDLQRVRSVKTKKIANTFLPSNEFCQNYVCRRQTKFQKKQVEQQHHKKRSTIDKEEEEEEEEEKEEKEQKQQQFFKNFSVTTKTPFFIKPEQGILGTAEEKFFFPVDKTLLRISFKATRRIKHKFVKVLDQKPQVHIARAGMSSQTFLDNSQYANFILENFDTSIVDTESTAFLLTCITNNIPCMIIRTLSDLAGREEEVVPTDVLEQIVQDLGTNLAIANLAIVKQLTKVIFCHE